MSASPSVKELLASIKAVDKSKISEAERQDLLAASAELQVKVENPWDTVFRLVFVTPAVFTSIKTLLDLKLFEKWVAAGGGPKTVTELAALVGAEEALLVRLIRVVASAGLTKVPAPHTYEMNEFSESLARAPQQAPFDYMWYFLIPTYLALPKFLGANQYKNPLMGPCNAAFNWGFNTCQTLFDHWAERPKEQESFANCMIGYAGGLAPWTDIFPTEKLLEGAGPNDVIVVDVGGGVGHDVMQVQRKHNLKPSQLVLQDLEGVLKQPVSKDSFKLQPHDFFKVQPVKGARAYYLHSVLHDWSDNQSTEILARIREAMGPHSRVLLHDMVLRPQDNPPVAAQSDVLMMAAFNALERTEEMWTKLATAAGLSVISIHTSKASPQSIVEMSLA
ncbi:MAG: hypothetical protein M1828_002380 [Chrysothrix sp. TS-e1954]|nr:MAG: hypothetical protein M1828_002380 [Chrysothrix sp. TS-e1954]